MPYIPKENRTRETFFRPKDRGELNWAITSRILEYWETCPKKYNDHCEIQAMLNEILQGAMANTDLDKIRYDEFRIETRLLMEEIDTLFLRYIMQTDDAAGAKQVLRHVETEMYRRLTSHYEDLIIQKNGDMPGYDMYERLKD